MPRLENIRSKVFNGLRTGGRARSHSYTYRCYSKLGFHLGKILIRGAKQLLTLRGSRTPRCGTGLNELGVVGDGAALVANGVLLEVGPSRRVENLAVARDAMEINAAGRVVMPGFIDCHTHLAFPPPDVADEHREAAARALVADTAKRTAARWLAYIGAMARHGTTTVEIKTGAGPNEDAEKKMLRVLSIVQDEPLDVVPTFLFKLPPREAMNQAGVEEYAKRLFADVPAHPKAETGAVRRFGLGCRTLASSLVRSLSGRRARSGLQMQGARRRNVCGCGDRDGGAKSGGEHGSFGACEAVGSLHAGGFADHGDAAAVRIVP